jgi:cytosine/adenosine deaminase-related metal-dependent hydrolase
VYGGSLICDSRTVIPSGAVYLEGDTIREVGGYAELRVRHPGAQLLGDAEMLVCPGLVNAHGHGKGLTDFQRGALDDTLETWRLRQLPSLAPGGQSWDTLWACLRLLESGVTATMHNHNLAAPEAAEEEMTGILEAYRRGGLRVAFAPTLADRNPFVYGDNEGFVAGLPPDLRSWCRARLERSGRFGPEQYFAAVRSLHARFSSPRTRILQGPLAPQWVQDESLREVKRQAAALGQRIHLHLLQTALQRLYGLRTYGKSLAAHLEDLGFLGPELTCGHCVWVGARDLELLAGRGVSVTHHPACNLRVRNGIAPVPAMLEAGLTVAVGMDEKELGDDKGYLEELRLAHKLHRLDSLRLDSACLQTRQVFRMGTENGARVLGFPAGRLAPGLQADLVLLRTGRMREPYTCGTLDPLDLLLYRGRSCDVDTVLVAGEVLLAGGQPTSLDRQEILRRLRESIPEGYAEAYRRANQPVTRLRARVAAWFEPWWAQAPEADPPLCGWPRPEL